MNRKILSILAIIAISICSAQAHDYHNNIPRKPTFKEQKQMDNLIDKRLKLTEEQKDHLKKNRSQHRKEMEKVVKKMEIQHEKIRNIYFSGIPKFQADIKTAPMKAELVLLKQNADKLRQEHRKNFESSLTEEQKIEFEKLRKEMAQNRPKNHR